MRIASELTVATTSPVGRSRVRASPVSAACVADQLGRAERALQPVGDGVLVPHGAGQGADDDEPDEDAAPEEQRAGVAADDALVDGLAHRGGEEGLADEPHDAEGDGDRRGCATGLADPPEVCRRAGQVGRAGVGVGQRDHLVHRTFGEDVPHAIFGPCHAPDRRSSSRLEVKPVGAYAVWPRWRQCARVLARAVEGVGQLVDLERSRCRRAGCGRRPDRRGAPTQGR